MTIDAEESAPLRGGPDRGQDRGKWYTPVMKRLWPQNGVFRTAIKNGMLILTWYFLSTVLGLYNKQLVGSKNGGLFGNGAFPAPLLMSSFQFGFQYLLAKTVFKVGLLKRQTAKEPMTWREYFKMVLPNGVTTGLDIGMSNKSLVFITMSFYTMCKSTVPMFLLFFAFIWKIEKPSWQLGIVVCVICSGLALLVEGETDFDMTGFLLVMTASCLSGLRFVLTQVLLHGHEDSGSFGGPLDIVEQLTPIMCITVLFLSLAWEQLWVTLPASPYFASIEHFSLTMAIILFGAVLAFLMVWTEYKVIKETSALTFMIAGTCKEVVTVIAAVIVMGDQFGAINAVGLVIVIFGVILFQIYKYNKIVTGEIPNSRPEGSELRVRKLGARESSGGGGSSRSADLEAEPLLGGGPERGPRSPSKMGASSSLLAAEEILSARSSVREFTAAVRIPQNS